MRSEMQPLEVIKDLFTKNAMTNKNNNNDLFSEMIQFSKFCFQSCILSPSIDLP